MTEEMKKLGIHKGQKNLQNRRNSDNSNSSYFNSKNSLGSFEDENEIENDLQLSQLIDSTNYFESIDNKSPIPTANLEMDIQEHRADLAGFHEKSQIDAKFSKRKFSLG
jgi:hypothetical protein